MRYAFLILAILMTACAPRITPAAFGSTPVPYLSATPSLTPAPNVVVIIETPRPTSTPYIYTIQSGDTFSQLAEKFKISSDDLRAANPNISPNSMPVGGTLLIPDLSSSPAAAWTPTPEPVPVTQVICHPSADSGLWCFALIQNITPNILENVSVLINLLDENNNVLASQTAFTPLNIIPPNSAQPAYVFFQNIPADVIPQARLISAVQVDANMAGYLPAKLNNVVTQIRWDGLTAYVSGQIYIPPESKAATQIWVAAVAYDKDGRAVGVKRWEGNSTQFTFSVSSLSSAIDRVEFFVEAR